MTIIANNKNIADDNVPLHYAQLYLAAGYSPIPVKPQSKEPVDKAWQRLRLTEKELSYRFPARNNVSVLLGEPSAGLIDIDLDDHNAVVLARYFLPETEFIFGRKSKPMSHWLYQVSHPGRTAKTTAGKRNIVEIRGTGGHTVFPGRSMRAPANTSISACHLMVNCRIPHEQLDKFSKQQLTRSPLHPCWWITGLRGFAMIWH